jgi:hypothetical protein
MTETKREIEFWSHEDFEYTGKEDLDEAIEAILDEVKTDPEEIEVCGYARIKPDLSVINTEDILGRVLDYLDANYGDGDDTSPSTEMIALTEKYVKNIASEYVSYICDVVETRTINVAQWRAEQLKESMR